MRSLPSFRSRLRALAFALAGLLAWVTPGFAQSVPNSPIGLSAQAVGSAIRLTWSPPNGGAAPTSYALDAGTLSGSSNLVSNYNVGNVLQFDSPALPPGGYFVRVRAVNVSGTSTPSTEVLVTLGGLPGAPVGFSASVTGARLTLSWSPPATGGAPTGYVIDAGNAPLTSNIVSAYPIGAGPGFSTDLPPGTYHLRLRARNATGVGPYSSEVVATIGGGGSGTPGPPTNFDYTVLGNQVQLRWSPPATGGTPQGYRIQVGTASGLQNVLVQDLGNVTSMDVAAPVDGSFYVRVLAYNQSGVSGPSNERVVTLYPSACRQGAFVATLVWDTGAVGQQAVDMDLHVIEPGNQMVYYGNRIGLTTQLDRDNTRGLGPENICSRRDNAGTPIAPSSGTYQIYARSYAGAQWPTTARITVRSFVGTPQETFRVIERVFTAPQQALNFATVTFPGGAITEVSGSRFAPLFTNEDPAMAPPKLTPPDGKQ